MNSGRRVLAVTAGVVIIIVVAAVVITRNLGELTRPGAGADCVSGALTPVRGLIGSEKEAFFDDERVLGRFECAGLKVEVDAAGSREMPAALARPGYAFAFPSSTPAAEKIMGERGIAERFTPFSSPMAVATFRPIVDVLTRADIVREAADGSAIVDVAALLAAARAGTRWDQLPGNTEYPVRKTVLLSTTDPRDSSSATMYLSIASHVANDGAVVTTPDQVAKVLPDLCRLVLDQGTKPETSQVLFDYYLKDGKGRTPMALIYEAQFVTQAPGHKPATTDEQVLLYPRPTVYSRHTLVPLDDAGRRVGQALRDDAELARLAAEHGFRPERATSEPVSRRPTPIDVVEPPSFEILESMLAGLDPASGGCAR